MNDLNEVLEVISQVLWRCVLWGAIFLLLWAVSFWLLRPVVFAQAMFFGVGPYKMALINYAAMAFMKVMILVFFLVPFIAIRRVLQKRRAAK